MSININKELKKKYYFQGFNGTPGLLLFGPPSGLKGMYKYLGFGFKSLHDFYEKDKCYYCYPIEDWQVIGKHIVDNVRKNKNYTREIWNKHQGINKKHLILLKKLDKLNLKKLSNKELIDNYQILAEAFNELLGVSHMVEGFTLTFEDNIRNLVKQEVKKENRDNDFNKILAELTEPTFPSFIGEAHNNILKVAIKFSKDKNIKKDLKKLEKNYYWLKNGYAASHHLDTEYFLKEIKAEIDKSINEEEILNYEKSFENIKKTKLQLVKELKLSENLIQLLNTSDFMAQLQDNRKHITTITISYVDNFLKEISKRFNFKHKNSRYLMPAEITLENLKNITDKELAKRRNKCIFFSTFESQKEKDPLKRYSMFTGKEADKYIKQLHIEEIEEITELKGNCASPGKVIGKVKVCRGASEISKMKEGNILVACMTQPEFVPAMKKASAVITDEGGLTCHAAIISRELKIPCIIGTKNATKVLKDGMEVEVDADNGIIKIK